MWGSDMGRCEVNLKLLKMYFAAKPLYDFFFPDKSILNWFSVEPDHYFESLRKKKLIKIEKNKFS